MAAPKGAKDKKAAKDNFLAKFWKDHRIHSVNFMKVWVNYDKNKSGFLETKELQAFLKDLMDLQGESTDSATIALYKTILMSSFDVTHDGKMELMELAQLMRVEDNFLKKFPHDRNKLTKKQFDEIFKHYDVDGSGTIKGEELVGLIRDIYQMLGHNFKAPELFKYAEAAQGAFGKSKDGSLTRDEVRLVLAKSGSK